MTRNEYVQYRLQRAKKSLQIGEKLLEDGFYEDAINRIYYAVYFAVSALLYTHKLYPKTHRGMKALFNKEFIQTGLIDKSAEDFYSQIFAKRFEADYEDFFQIDFLRTKQYYNEANNLITIIEDILNRTTND
jgi:uncharacterized protein (UPF0332 family)